MPAEALLCGRADADMRLLLLHGAPPQKLRRGECCCCRRPLCRRPAGIVFRCRILAVQRTDAADLAPRLVQMIDYLGYLIRRHIAVYKQACL